MAAISAYCFFVTGCLLECIVFARGEWDRYSPIIAQIGATGLVLVFLVLKLSGISWAVSATETIVLSSILLLGLYASMVTYRIIFHPLKSFPGPLSAKLTAFWAVKENIPRLQFYRAVQQLHEKHGDFVRIRPREISISHSDAIEDVHGPRSKCTKGEFYDFHYPHRSMQMTRDAAFHSRKRKVWNRAFHPKALDAYEQRLRDNCLRLMDLLERESYGSRLVDASYMFMYFGFDIMSDLTFGKPLGMLTTGKPDYMVQQYHDAKKILGTVITMPWIMVLLQNLPILRGETGKFKKWCYDRLEERKKMKPTQPDFYTYFAENVSNAARDVAQDFEDNATYDAELAIVAGGDTVACALADICYLMAKHPHYLQRLREEIDPLYDENEEVAHKDLVALPFLNGIINEAIRLFPPAPGGMQRLTPPEGAVIAGRYIPGNTNVSTPTYTLHRDTRWFVKPNEFIPERWFANSKLIRQKAAFAPFSHGPNNCAGKPLAYMEMRMVTASMSRRFDWQMEPGKEEECSRIFENQPDCFVVKTPPLPMIFRARTRSNAGGN